MTRNTQAADAVRLPVRGSGFTLVDGDIGRALEGWRLYLTPGGYVVAYAAGETHLLQHLVLGQALDGSVVDHRNGDKRDNRRANLRHVSQGRNLLNQRPGLRGSRRPFHGISRTNGRWMPFVGRRGRVRYGPQVGQPLLAAFCRDDLVRRVWHANEGVNFPFSVRRQDVAGLLRSSAGRLFGVWFVKRSDGTLRHMTCRTDVAKGTTGGQLAFDPQDRDLLGVYDVQKAAYRFIPLENVLALKVDGKAFRVVHREDP